MTEFTIAILGIAFGLLTLNLVTSRKKDRQINIDFPTDNEEQRGSVRAERPRAAVR